MYGKIFTTIYEGTLHGHWQAIVTMQQFITLSDPNGVVDMTLEAMASKTSIPLAILRDGVKFLSKPDPRSRTVGEEGRRIVLLDDHRDWGWRLVNHWKYMGLRNLEQKREADRVRIAEKRKGTNDVAITSPMSPTKTKTKTSTKAGAERGSRLPADWKPNATLLAWMKEARPDLDPTTVTDNFRDYWVSKPGKNATKLDWSAAFRNWVRGEKQRYAGPPGAPQVPKRILCGNCGVHLTGGWTQSPKGRVCNPCHAGYMNGAWPEAPQ